MYFWAYAFLWIILTFAMTTYSRTLIYYKSLIMNKKHSLICLLLLLFLVSCTDEDRTLTFSDVTYVRNFPEHCTVIESTKVPLDLPGLRDIKLKDSILFVSQDGQDRSVKMFGYPSLAYLGDFVMIGNGPGELLSAPFFSETSFSRHNDSLYISIPDFKMKIVRYNVTAALSGDAGCFTQHPLELGGSALGVYSFDESTYYYMSLSQGMTSLTRHLIVDGVEQALEALEELNTAKLSINDGYAFNLLSAIPAYDSNSGVIVECCLAANRLNFYSVNDPSFKKTVVIGNKLSSIKEAEARMKLAPVLPGCTFSVKTYDDCFLVLYGNGIPDSKERTVLVFDWQGNPLQRIDLPSKVRAVDIDFDNRTLIAADYETEELYFHKY